MLLQGVLGAMHVLDRLNHRTTSNTLDPVPTITPVHLTSLPVLRLDTQDRTRGMDLLWASKEGMETLFVVLKSPPKCLAVLVLLLVNLADVQDRLQTYPANLGYLLRKVKTRDSKATAATWVTKCTASKVHNMAVDQAA